MSRNTLVVWGHACLARLRGGVFLPLSGLLIVTVLLVSPKGDFPLNDDWVYGKMVEGVVSPEKPVAHPYAAASAIGQAVLGAPFVLVFGFDFTALRACTLLLALVAAWATARAARELALSWAMSFLIGATVFWNPITLSLSYTFMTDVPFLALMSLSGWFYLRALRTGRNVDVLLATTFAAYGFFIRQFAVCVTAAYLFALLWPASTERRRLFTRHAVAISAPWFLAALVYVWWSTSSDTSYAWTNTMLKGALLLKPFRAVRYAFVAAMYAGLFLAPFLVPAMWDRLLGRTAWSQTEQRVFRFTLAGAVIMACGLGAWRMPLLGNMLRDTGVGPLTLQDVWFHNPKWSPVSLSGWWWAPTALSMWCASHLAVTLWQTIRPQPMDKPKKATDPRILFLILWGLSLLLVPYNPLLPVTFDRYLIPALAPLALFLALRNGPRHLFLTIFLCTVFYGFAVVGLQDYMAWNRARWEAIERFEQDHGVAVERLDGGYEFNGMYTTDEFMRRHHSTDFNTSGQHPWWVLDDSYAVSFLPRDGYEILDRVSYFSWLGMENREILMLRRTNL